VTPTEEFAEFVGASSARLRRAAFLMCGDWHMAEDLAQTTLVRLFVSWRRISRRGAAYSYAMRTLTNLYLADRRTRRAGELVTGNLPERAAEPPAPELRMVVLDALATLPPSARAVVVLRYWSDMSVAQVADLLGWSTSTVTSQSSRALARLRPLLGDIWDEPGTGDPPLDDRHEQRKARHG
jgi:RNA polymerase sigma-70 factor (sigma-E family)